MSIDDTSESLPTAAGIATAQPQETTAQRILAGAIAIFVVAMLVQLAGDSYLRGDGSYYLRDAARFASGHLPQSRYSPGFALLLAPVVWVFRHNYAAAANAAIVLNIGFAAAGFVLLYSFMQKWLEPIPAALSVAAFALSQGVLIYFSEVRPEALCLLILMGMVVAIRRDAQWWAVALGGLAMLIRIALAPLVLVTLAVAAWRHPKQLVASAAAFAAAALAYLATQSPVEDSYMAIGDAYQAKLSIVGRLEAASRTARTGVVNYVRFGLPRLVVPFRVLRPGIGAVVGVLVTAAMVGGVVMLLRRNPHQSLLVAAVAGFTVYQLALLNWPVRDLSAVRLLSPAPAVPLLGLVTVVVWGVGRLGLGRAPTTAIAALGLLALVSAVGSAAAIPGHISDIRTGGFAAAQKAARPGIPPGVLISTDPAGTELIIGRRALGYPLRRDIDDYARRNNVCVAVLTREMDMDAAQWAEMYRDRILAAVRETEVVTVRRPWCSPGG